VTVSHKIGVLKLWNSATSTVRKQFKVSPSGILSIASLFQVERKPMFLLQMKTGAVMVYNFQKNKVLFETPVAHSAQIQKFKFAPSDWKLMLSVGFDGTIRLWDA
jgi:WD40 repeat protein